MHKMWNEVIASENKVNYSKLFPSEGEKFEQKKNKVLYWTHAVKLVLSIWKGMHSKINYLFLCISKTFCVFQTLFKIACLVSDFWLILYLCLILFIYLWFWQTEGSHEDLHRKQCHLSVFHGQFSGPSK